MRKSYIEIVYLTDRLTEEDKGMVEQAARLWEQIIVGDLPDYEFEHKIQWGDDILIEKGEVIDDIRIYVSYLDFDPVAGGAGGFGGVMEERDTGLPLIGIIEIPSRTNFEEANYPHVDTEMHNIITHEICHALGFGTITPWDSFVKKKDGRSYFDGPQAIEAFNAAGGTSYEGNKVPLADAAHWDDILFNDIMVNGAFDVRISSVTVAAFADIGYEVRPSPTKDVRVRPMEEKMKEWATKKDERNKWIDGLRGEAGKAVAGSVRQHPYCALE